MQRRWLPARAVSATPVDADTQRLPWSIRLTAPRRLAIVAVLAPFVYWIGPAVVGYMERGIAHLP